MNYGHTCKTCGETILSNDKAEVKAWRKEHQCAFQTRTYGRHQFRKVSDPPNKPKREHVRSRRSTVKHREGLYV